MIYLAGGLSLATGLCYTLFEKDVDYIIDDNHDGSAASGGMEFRYTGLTVRGVKSK